jgi:ABC-type Fe3+ transport system substrate-binding protein
MSRQSKWMHLTRGAVLLIGIALLAAACGSDPTPTPRPTATPVPTVDAAAAFQTEWDALAAAAKKEGKLIIAAGRSGARDLRPVWEVFQEKFDIEVIISGGANQDTTDRILAEQSAGRYDVDLISADPLRGAQILAGGGLQPIEPFFTHPEVLDKSGWYLGDYTWGDGDSKYFFVYSATVSRRNQVNAGYNTDMVPQEDVDAIKVDRDFLKPEFVAKYKGLVTMYPPPPYGTGGGAYYSLTVHPDLGQQFLVDMMNAFDVEFIADARVAADAVAQGAFAWSFLGAITTQNLHAMDKEGLPVKRFRKNMPLQSPSLSGGSSASQIMIPIQQPHPNAAKLGLNWFLSVEGQSTANNLAATREGSTPRPSLRDDVDLGKTDPDDRRDPGVVYRCVECDPSEVDAAEEAYVFARGIYEGLVGIN